MSFLLDSCLFEKNTPLFQNNTNLLSQNRVPFSDITQQMNSFFNFKKNQQINIFPKNFNDFSNEKQNYTFLKKKSFGERMNNSEKNEEYKDKKVFTNKIKKYSCDINNNHISLINNLNEDNEEEDKENLCTNNDSNNNESPLCFNQILNEAINEKKELDKIEKDRKKANKIKQIKMHLIHRKFAMDFSNKNENKENINNNSKINYSLYFQEKQKEKEEKELNMMNLD